MMQRMPAVAALAVRSALRSRLFVSLLCLLLLAVACAPAMLKGDGTAAGRVRILLQYSLGFSAAILAVGSMWTACGAFSQEIENRQIWLVAVKPIPRFELWMGKWLGLVTMNAVLLAMAGAATLALALRTARDSAVPPAERGVIASEVLVGRRILRPRAEDLGTEAARDAREFFALADGRATDGRSAADLADWLAKRERSRRATVAPAQSRTWVFDLPPRFSAPGTPGGTCSLRLRLRTSAWAERPVRGHWQAGAPGEPARFRSASQRFPDGPFVVPLPAGILEGGGTLAVTFVNAGREESSTAAFDPDTGVELLAAEGSFLPNYCRGLLVVLCGLALVTAMGLLCGTVFSFPVAVFLACSILAIVSLSGLFVEGVAAYAAASPETATLTRIGEALARAVHAVARPATAARPIASLADGLLIPTTSVAQALAVSGIGYPAVLGLLGAWVLRRRELALPGAG